MFFFTFYRKGLETNICWQLMIIILCLKRFSLRWVIKDFFWWSISTALPCRPHEPCALRGQLNYARPWPCPQFCIVVVVMKRDSNGGHENTSCVTRTLQKYYIQLIFSRASTHKIIYFMNVVWIMNVWIFFTIMFSMFYWKHIWSRTGISCQLFICYSSPRY